MNQTVSLPLLPLKHTVLLPYVMIPISIGRAGSIAAVEAALASEDKLLAVFAQRDADIEVPRREDLFSVGAQVVIKRMARTAQGMELIIQGTERIELEEVEQTEPYTRARVRRVPVEPDTSAVAQALFRELISQAAQIQEMVQPSAQFDVQQMAVQSADPMQLVYLIAAMSGLDFEKSQNLLEAETSLGAMRQLHDALTHELQILRVQEQIASRAQTEIGKEQRDYVLRRQLRAIQQELGEQSPEQSEVADLRRQLDEATLPEAVRKEVERGLNRLESIPSAAPDFQVIRTHLELILELPWEEVTQDNLDLSRARQVLDEDHYGLTEIKERIIEHLAVLKLNPEAKAPIVCLVGPPGVGKTSLGQSIARALGRKFERLSLGGMHDEAELRGHRRTYIGAMPGRVIQAIRRAGVRNPLLMLDEVDKLGRDFRGDPASALLEILDPAQNNTFRDNYLDLPFDLSKVLFLTTANTTDSIPQPLLDRMELLRLSGYTDQEKQEIARRYLLPRQLRESGVTAEQLQIPDETLLIVINRYTREAGVRELERMLGRLARKIAVRVADGQTEPVTIQPEDLTGMLGAQRFFLEDARKQLPAGVATGLAWTPTGGDVLYIETIALPEGDQQLKLTGQLGDVMKESALAAQSYIISHCGALGIDPPKAGVHVHVPAGAIPKDGPSAGVTIVTALASLFTGYEIRNDTAMTGEITLSGLVLPVGGIKEKVLAARRAGLSRVILPRGNEKDLADIPPEVRDAMEFEFADQIDDVLTAAIPELAERLLHAPVG